MIFVQLQLWRTVEGKEVVAINITVNLLPFHNSCLHLTLSRVSDIGPILPLEQ